MKGGGCCRGGLRRSNPTSSQAPGGERSSNNSLCVPARRRPQVQAQVPLQSPDTLPPWSSVMRSHSSVLSWCLRAHRTLKWAATLFWSLMISSSTRRWKLTIRGTGYRWFWTWRRLSKTKPLCAKLKLSAARAAPTRPLSASLWPGWEFPYRGPALWRTWASSRNSWRGPTVWTPAKLRKSAHQVCISSARK